MSKISRLTAPVVQPIPRRQCQVILPDDPSWCVTRQEAFGPKSKRRFMKNKRPGWDAQQCQRYAEYEIDGVSLCQGHAGRKCLSDRLGEPFPFAVRPTAG